jgi:DNA-binding Xre family transcriptional regulator
MSSATLAKLGKNQIVSMDVLGRICAALKCDVGDIVSYVEEEL